MKEALKNTTILVIVCTLVGIIIVCLNGGFMYLRDKVNQRYFYFCTTSADLNNGDIAEILTSHVEFNPCKSRQLVKIPAEIVENNDYNPHD